MGNYLEIIKFKDVNINNSFFDSLKADYKGFEEWVNRKSEEEAYVKFEDEELQGFLYLKIENGPVEDVEPLIDYSKILKIGTFKINPHGTRLGERFIKKALDYSVSKNVDACYVTIFEKHNTLIELLEKYGFLRYGKKETTNGAELVLLKDMRLLHNNILLDYPLINKKNCNKYVLSIYPQYHSLMFPDSILNNESVDILEDVSYTNSIHKIYVCRMPVQEAKQGDIFVMYRTKTPGHNAEYTSVVTSICIVEDIKSQDEFKDFDSFFNYANSYSIFNRKDLKYWYDKGECKVIRMTYNAALSKRLIRKKLIEEIGVSREIYWGFFKLTNEQFDRIIEEGGVCESIIID